MQLILCENYEQLSLEAATIVTKQIKQKPNSVLGLATGSTPLGLYNALIQNYQKGEISFQDVTTFNLDEYYPIHPENPQSYYYFMQKHLFSSIDIKQENVHILNGSTHCPENECSSFESLIQQCGGIDLQVLGIGHNGHIGFNEPGTTLPIHTHLTQLSKSTIQANARFFKTIEQVPRQALTMGIGTILKAKKIILLVSGESKHPIVKKLLNGDLDTNVPASMLKLHPNSLFICDASAYYGKASSQRMDFERSK